MTQDDILVVETSPVRSTGRARVNSEVLDKLDISSGELAVVSTDKKDILLSLFGDNLIEEGKIKLRILDAEKLGTEEGEEIKIRKHQKLLKKLL